MARTLYMNDGSTEYIFAGQTEEATLQKIIREKLGSDCEELYLEIIADLKGIEGDDWEKIADGYYRMAMDAMNGLRDALDKPRLSRKSLTLIYNDLANNL